MEHGLHVYSRFQRITGVFFKSPSFSSTSDALRILYISSRGKKISYEADMGLKSPLGENNWVDPKAWSMQIRKLLPHPWNLPPFSFSFCELRHGSSYRRLWSRQLLQLPWHEKDVRDRWSV